MKVRLVFFIAVNSKFSGLAEEAGLVLGFILLHAGGPDLINPLPGSL